MNFTEKQTHLKRLLVDKDIKKQDLCKRMGIKPPDLSWMLQREMENRIDSAISLAESWR